MENGGRNKGLWNRIWRYRMIYLFLIPAIIWYAVFCYYPMYGLLLSVKEFKYSLGIMKSPWVGLKWFRNFLSDGQFYLVLGNTVKITALKLLVGFPAPILFAVLINEIRSHGFKRVVQTLSYLPYFVSWVVAAALLTKLLSPYSGLVNDLRLMMDPQAEPIFYLGEPKYFYPVVILTDLWKNIGWNSIIYIAAISNIDPNLYEAAEIDGAGRIGRIWHITLPAIRPTIAVLLIMSMSGILNAGFDQIYLLQQPSTLQVAEVIDTYVLKKGIQQAQFEYATAIGMFKSLISLVVVVSVNWIVRKLSEVSLW